MTGFVLTLPASRAEVTRSLLCRRVGSKHELPLRSDSCSHNQRRCVIPEITNVKRRFPYPAILIPGFRFFPWPAGQAPPPICLRPAKVPESGTHLNLFPSHMVYGTKW